MKQAVDHFDRYFELIDRMEHPSGQLRLGLLVSDSTDAAAADLRPRLPSLRARLPGLRARYARVTLVERDFGFHLPPGSPRWPHPWQPAKRAALAKSRNHLLFAALRDEDWVLWIDVDVAAYRPDILARLLATGKDIVHSHCVTRLGGTMPLVRADAHHSGLIFPPYPYRRESRFARRDRPHGHPGALGEIETEGLALIAKDMGVECWGMPALEIVHAGS